MLVTATATGQVAIGPVAGGGDPTAGGLDLMAPVSMPVPMPVPIMEDGYHDGPEWVTVQRLELRPDGLRSVACERRGRTFRGALGPWALVQLAPSTPAGPFRGADVAEVVPLSPRLGLFRVRGRPAEDGLALATRLAALPFVTQAVPDLFLERASHAIDVPPDDPRYPAQWYLERLQIERAWDLTTGRASTVVVVIDGGCDMDHPDLVDRFEGGIDLVDDDDDPSPLPGVEGNNHGTACAGLIAAAGDNGEGIAGVCPDCRMHCVRLYGQGDKQLVPVSADVAAFEYAFSVDAAVVSNSWGFADPMPVPSILREAIESLTDTGRGGRGALVVFAAGNENRLLSDDELVAVDGVLNVGAVNNFDEAAPFSNYGPSVDLTSPTGTFTTDIAGADGDDPGDYTDLFGGTSSACPVAAGVAALVVSAAPEMDARSIGEVLVDTARPAPYAMNDAAGHDPIYGRGIIDPEAALRAVLQLPERDAGSPAVPDAGRSEDLRSPDGGASARRPETRRRSSCGVGTPGTVGGGPSNGGPAAPLLLLLAAVYLGRRGRGVRLA